jgi:hypothetical protein
VIENDWAVLLRSYNVKKLHSNPKACDYSTPSSLLYRIRGALELKAASFLVVLTKKYYCYRCILLAIISSESSKTGLSQ